MHENVSKENPLLFTGPCAVSVAFVFDDSADASKRLAAWAFGVSPGQTLRLTSRGYPSPRPARKPRRTYPKTAGPTFQGTFEPYVASVISSGKGGRIN